MTFEFLEENGYVRNRWRRWIPGPKHGPARSAGVYGVPRPGPEHLDVLLSRCEQLRTWARACGFELDCVAGDLGLLDQAFDEASDLARGELGRPMPVAAVGSQAGLYLGTVIIATVPGTRWRLWPNGHPVVCLPSGRDLDVVAMAIDRVNKGAALLADVYADAAAGPRR
ncbi:MAG TPA: DUF6278 family protein [Streptosporangiaceae bacterium]